MIKYMNNFSRNYEKILKTLQSVESSMSFLNQIRKPKLSDKTIRFAHKSL